MQKDYYKLEGLLYNQKKRIRKKIVAIDGSFDAINVFTCRFSLYSSSISYRMMTIDLNDHFNVSFIL